MKGMLSQTVSPIQTFKHFFSLCFEASDLVSDLEGFLGNDMDGELFLNFLFTFTLEDKIWLKKRVCHTKTYIYIMQGILTLSILKGSAQIQYWHNILPCTK